MANNEKIVFNGKQINYKKLTDESIEKLYRNMKKKEVLLYKQILEMQNELGIVNDEDLNDFAEFNR